MGLWPPGGRSDPGDDSTPEISMLDSSYSEELVPRPRGWITPSLLFLVRVRQGSRGWGEISIIFTGNSQRRNGAASRYLLTRLLPSPGKGQNPQGMKRGSLALPSHFEIPCAGLFFWENGQGLT